MRNSRAPDWGGLVQPEVFYWNLCKKKELEEAKANRIFPRDGRNAACPLQPLGTLRGCEGLTYGGVFSVQNTHKMPHKIPLATTNCCFFFFFFFPTDNSFSPFLTCHFTKGYSWEKNEPADEDGGRAACTGQGCLIPMDSCKLQHFGGNQENPHTAGSEMGQGEGRQDQRHTAQKEFCSQEFQRAPWAAMHCPVQLSKNALIPSGHS